MIIYCHFAWVGERIKKGSEPLRHHIDRSMVAARRLVSAFGPFMKLNIGDGGGIIATPGDKKRTRRKGREGSEGREGTGAQGTGKRKQLRMVEKEHREGRGIEADSGEHDCEMKTQTTVESHFSLHGNCPFKYSTANRNIVG